MEWFLNDFQERFADSGLKVLFRSIGEEARDIHILI
jgi:hypothetical protein